MKNEDVVSVMEMALSGHQAHPDPRDVIEGLDAETAGRRPEAATHSIHEILGHLVFWQDLTLAWLGGVEPPDPESEGETWPASEQPESEEALAALIARFRDGLATAGDLARETDLAAPLPGLPGIPRLSALQVLASHNSYHLGQIALLRRLRGG